MSDPGAAPAKRIAQRVAETTRIAPEFLVARHPFPPRAKVEITARCDLRCSFCTLTYKEREKGDIDGGLMLRLLREIRDLGVQEVGLFWLGEPLLCEDLPRYVAFAKTIGIPYVFVTTNGRMADPQRLRRLVDAGIDSIKFSVNAGDRQSYLKLCGVDAFDRVIANVRAAAELRGPGGRPAIYASTACDPQDRRVYDAVHSLIGGLMDQHYLLPIYGPPAQQASGARSLAQMLPCWSLFTEPHISYDGYLSACFCDHDPKYYMANLREMPLAQAWVSPKFVELRERHLARDVSGTPCQDCVAYRR